MKRDIKVGNTHMIYGLKDSLCGVNFQYSTYTYIYTLHIHIRICNQGSVGNCCVIRVRF